MRLNLTFNKFKLKTYKYSTLKSLINLRELLADPKKLKQNALERRMTVNIDLIKELNDQRIELSKTLNTLNGQRKSFVSIDKKEERKDLISKLSEIECNLMKEVLSLPNWSSEKSPILENEVIKTVPSDFDVLKVSRATADHVDICKNFDLVDFEGPARTTGAHFYALKGVVAMLEMALISWTINRAAQRGFLPISVPDCVRERFVVGCGFQPRRKLENGLPVYTINDPAKGPDDEDPLVLAGTSEMYLASQYSGQTLSSNDLPLKFVGVSHCFRSEVGHHTAASRGLYRVHQFTKVELFVFCEPAGSERYFEEITSLQADLLNELKLPFRVLEMARWELGSASSRKWDHEVWMPGRKLWGEVMSTSECTDFQSRRLAIRLKQPKEKDLTFPYTLNGTACAIPRIIMALLEWGWDPNEPEYLNFPAVLEPFYPTPLRKQNNLTIRFK